MQKDRILIAFMWLKKSSKFCLLVFFCFSLVSSTKLSSTHTTPKKKYNITWENGFKLIRAGEISTGFYVLDSLFEKDTDPDSVRIQIANVFRIMCPGFTSDSVLKLNNTNNDSFQDSIALLSYKYKVIRNFNNTKRKLPSFCYNASFSVQKPFQLKFKGLLSPILPHLVTNHQFMNTELDYDLIEQLWDHSDSITCTIYLDLENTKLSISDYLSDYVSGLFDSIKMKNDLDKYRALSLRCYKRRSFGNNSDRFTAIIAFDRFFPDRKSTSTTNTLIVRYTVVVQAPASVTDLAEAKFQEILKSM